MNKSKILSTTIMFIAIVVSIALFKSIFGEINSLVAVTGVTAALSLLDRDYTINPIKNTIYFVTLEIFLGISSYLSSLNAFLSLIITFLVIFYIVYSFTYNTRKPVYIGFTLGYFFMLYTPIPIQEMSTRLLGLATCGLAIMLLQIIINKNSIQKQTDTKLKIILNSTKKQIKLINRKSTIKHILDINKSNHIILRNLIDLLHEYIDRGAQFPTYLFQKLFIIYFLDSLNLKINEVLKSKKIININQFNKIFNILTSIENFIDDKSKFNNLINELNTYLSSNELFEDKDYFVLELNLYLDILKNDLESIQNNNFSNLYNQYIYQKDKVYNLKNNISKDSLKFTLAFRCALITSIGVFIVNLFNIELGKWIIFTLHAIIQPYSDYSKTKGYQRLYGTAIGLIIFEILFSIFTSTSSRTIILLLAGYLSTYPENYGYKMIFITISALGASSLTSNIGIVGFERILFVIIGTLIALCANKIILPYKITEATKSHINNSILLNSEILSTICKKYSRFSTSEELINNLLIRNKLLTRKIDYNNTLISSDDINEYIYNQHTFINDIRILSYSFINIKNISHNAKLLKYINLLIEEDIDEYTISNYIHSMEDVLSKLVLISIFRIKINILKSKTLSDHILKTI